MKAEAPDLLKGWNWYMPFGLQSTGQTSHRTDADSCGRDIDSISSRQE